MGINGNRKRVEELTMQGWSASEIGRELDIATGTVYAHRHAARRRRRNPMSETPVGLAGGRPRKHNQGETNDKTRRNGVELHPAQQAGHS
jgi:transposase